MINTAFNSEILVEEFQLGETLNQCVHSNRRSDFALLLSMLTDDVLAHSQFSLPKTEQQAKEYSDESLRKQFELAEKAPLALKDLEDLGEFDQAQLVAEQQLATLHLQNSLKPKALAFRDDVKHINQDVMTNTSLYCQQKYQQKSLSSVENKKLPFNVNEWLKTVQTTIVKAPIMQVTA